MPGLSHPWHARRVSTPKRKAAAKAPASPPKRATASKKPAPRADFGAPIDGFFTRQPPHLRAILDALRAIVESEAPAASAAIKWGMPVYSLGRTTICALGAHKSHVNLILFGPPDGFDDPEGRLSGEGKIGRHLRLESIEELPRASVRAWVRRATELAAQG